MPNRKWRFLRTMAFAMALCLLTTSLAPNIAIACEGGGEEKESGGEFPTSMTISPKPYKFTKVEKREFIIEDTSLFTFFEIENITSTDAKFKPLRECVGKTLFAFNFPESCKEHVEVAAPFETGKSAVLEVWTFGGDETDNLSS